MTNFARPNSAPQAPQTPPSRRSTVVGLLSLALAAASAAAFWPAKAVSAHAAQASPASAEYYTTTVQPILSTNCYRCHGGINHRGGLNIDTKAGMMKGGKDGSVLTPGHPEDSLLIKLIRHEGPAADPMPMPPKSKLTDAEIASVTAWVKAGAIMPEDKP